MAKLYHPFHDLKYLDLVEDVLKNGRRKQNRTGVATYSVVGRQMRFDLSDHTIPMLTSKQMFVRGTIVELLDLFIAGTSNVRKIQEQKVHIWDEWADKDGELGPVYGVQWRKWKRHTEVGREPGGLCHTVVDEVDQLADLVHKLKTNPFDRRLIVSAWNVAELDKMALPPCHYLFQCYVDELTPKERARIFLKNNTAPSDVTDSELEEATRIFDEAGVPKLRLSMILNQRSADVGLGVPFNIVQYSMLLHMLAHVAEMAIGEFIWNGGDVHIYENHIEPLKGQLENKISAAPTLRFARKITDIDDFKLEDFIIEGYVPGPKIPMDVAI